MQRPIDQLTGQLSALIPQLQEEVAGLIRSRDAAWKDRDQFVSEVREALGLKNDPPFGMTAPHPVAIIRDLVARKPVFGRGLADLLHDVADELALARSKHGAHHSAHEAWAVLKEEVDELWEEVRQKRENRNPERMRKECLQVAACALRMIIDVVDVMPQLPPEVFICPHCDARHRRGPLNGKDVYRCLVCGNTTKVELKKGNGTWSSARTAANHAGGECCAGTAVSSSAPTAGTTNIGASPATTRSSAGT